MYEKFYKLNDRPFQLTPDARFFYPSQGHRKALAFLRYGVQQGEGFVVITGGVGTGKTTLVQTLLDELKDQRIATASVVTTQLEDDEMIRAVAAGFGLPFQRLDKVSLLKNLETFFRDCVRQRKRVLLVVDEAQNLPARSIEELRMLSNFQFQGKPLVQTFLLGQDQLRARIASLEFEQLRQRITAVHHLGALNVNETKEYIEHRLRCAGWQSDPLITNAAFLAIHEATNGIPRRINNVCDRLMLFGFLEGLHKIEEQAVTNVVQEMRDEYGEIGERADVDAAAPFDKNGAAFPNTGGPNTVFASTDIAPLTAAVQELTSVLRGEMHALRGVLERLAGLPVSGALQIGALQSGPLQSGPMHSSVAQSGEPMPRVEVSRADVLNSNDDELSLLDDPTAPPLAESVAVTPTLTGSQDIAAHPIASDEPRH